MAIGFEHTKVLRQDIGALLTDEESSRISASAQVVLWLGSVGLYGAVKHY